MLILSLGLNYQNKRNDPEDHRINTPATASLRNRYTSPPLPSIDLSRDLDVHNSSSSVEVFGEARQLWREDSATRKEPLPRKPKKRNSEEAELDIRLSQSSFTAVDSFPDFASPDFPESSIKDVATKLPATIPKISQQNASDTFTAQHQSPTKSETPNKRLKIVKGSSQASPTKATRLPNIFSVGGFSGNPSTLFKQMEHSGKHAKRKKAIADSEDEEEGLETEEFAGAMSYAKSPGLKHDSCTADYPLLPKAPDLSNAQSDHVRMEKSCVSEMNFVKFERSSSIPDATKAVNDASPFQRDSPTKLSQTQSFALTVEKAGEELSKSQQAAISLFFKLQLYQIRNYCERLNRDLHCVAEKTYKAIMAGGEENPGLRKQARSLKLKANAVERLLELRDGYNALSRKREDLKSRLIAAIKEDQDASQYAQDLEENRSTARSLFEFELQIAELLTQAALPLQNSQTSPDNGIFQASDAIATERSTLLVKSTQMSQNVPCDPDISNSIPTNLGASHFVQQTQVLPPAPGTPKGHSSSKSSELLKSGLQTYASSPKTSKMTAFFSPSKSGQRKENLGLKFCTFDKSEIKLTNPKAILKQSFRQDTTTGSVGKEETFFKNMGSPLEAVFGEEDFGRDEDDQEMLEVAEQLEDIYTRPGSGARKESREVFAETTGNFVRVERHKSRSTLPNSSSRTLQMQHEWSRDVKAAMKDRFHLRGFRPNQLEAINATLSGKDTFVLMPTGGGKSLCYQLPSVIGSGRTRGVTLVISPLLSLMQDQVSHLQKLKIQAFLFNGEVTAEDRKLVIQNLRDPQVEKYIQLLYITPEMIIKSGMLTDTLRDLYSRQKLARIVIDEAHCVSQWGHDFRPDYKALGRVRSEYKGVPVMALTATATENVKVDVIHNLGMQNCEILTQSFNRPNLTYNIRSKGKEKAVLDDIAATIRTSYKGHSGIVYCLSRKSCEKIAKKLKKEYGISAHHYHAGMNSSEKSLVQEQWQAGMYDVIVATIAFGMGIDKSNVRFVIHYTIPKSLEGYYQETGRAGRDGKRSGCYLYYGYQDTSAIKRMIDNGEGSWEQKERQRQMLRNVIGFCENRSDCRRVQILNYFNEPFKAEDCNAACDNCNSKSTFETRDFTKYAIAAITLVKRIARDEVTLLHCVDVFRGGKSKKITDLQHGNLEQYGIGSILDRGDVERLFYRLLSEDVLKEKPKVNKSGFAINHIRVSYLA